MDCRFGLEGGFTEFVKLKAQDRRVMEWRVLVMMDGFERME